MLRRRAESRVKLRREEEGAKKGAVIRQFRFVKVNHFQRGLARPWNARAIAERRRRRRHRRVRRGAKNEDAASGHPRPPYEMINFTHHLGNSQILSKLLKIIYFVWTTNRWWGSFLTCTATNMMNNIHIREKRHSCWVCMWLQSKKEIRNLIYLTDQMSSTFAFIIQK